MVELIKPRRLSPGDTVGITAPASWVDTEQVKAATSILVNMGLNVRLGDTVFMQHGYLAGTDEARAGELNAMFADPAIKAIICARGGYGPGESQICWIISSFGLIRRFSGVIVILPFCMQRLAKLRVWLLFMDP